MRIPAGVRVGACTHTGVVRVHNEDDYLVGTVGQGDDALLLCGIADGIGGAAGGAEASRTALHGLGAAVLDASLTTDAEARLRAGFDAAAERLAEQATAVPFLREMGTTLTAMLLGRGRVVVGHVGDTRLYRLTGGRLEQVTEDHAAREPDNVLLRWVGGGQRRVEADFTALTTAPGERWLLLSDGIWSVVTEAELSRLARGGDPNAAAAALVARALDGGGPDNATAVVVEVAPAGATEVSAELPRDERPRSRDRWPRARSLQAPWWPWLVFALALALGGGLLLQRVWGIDVWSARFWERDLWSWIVG
ncbi:MAG: serine/threonine-protein phosphatase [Planctomycetes bacterium]|nr:serine/threonine-protein phosphatase [Planctomycetota bacterium]